MMSSLVLWEPIPSTSSVDETVDSLIIADKRATLLIDGASTFSDTFGGVNDGTLVVNDSSRMIVGTNTTNTTLSNVGTIDLVNSYAPVRNVWSFRWHAGFVDGSGAY